MNNSQAKQVLSILFDAPTAYDQDVIAALETITIDTLVNALSKWHGSRACIHSTSGYSYTIRLYAGTFLLLPSFVAKGHTTRSITVHWSTDLLHSHQSIGCALSETSSSFAKAYGDIFFNVRSLTDIINDYKSDDRSARDNNGKGLFLVLKQCALEQGHSEETYKRETCTFIANHENLTSLSTSLASMCR